jgi:dethiobiotin synthase
MVCKKISFPKILFVTGTDTGVGKTFVSAMLALGLKGGYWKPIQTGSDWDRNWVATHTGLPKKHFFPERHLLKKPLSPHLAAREEKTHIHLSDFVLPEFSSLPHLIIEGCGGVLVPINEDHFILDLIAKWNAPVLVVARNTLGTINHTLLTLRQIQDKGLSVFGVILNGEKHTDHKPTVETFGGVPVLAEIEPVSNISSSVMEQIFFRSFC